VDYTREQVEKAVKSKGYVWFDSDTNYDVNIVGIRNSSTGQNVTNLFDDRITVSYKIDGELKFHSWPATTDPGRRGVLESENPAGVARLVEGQYRGSHSIGLHKGRYEALRQAKEVKVYRDANRDLRYDENRIQTGIFYINMHKAGADSTYVENWSEGCQVFKRASDFDEFMGICRKARTVHGNSFTYTLLESSDIE